MDAQHVPPSSWLTMWKEIVNDKLALIGLIIFFIILISTFVVDANIDSGTATRVYPAARNQAPCAVHALGTDPGGRDMVDMIFLGAKNTFVVAFGITVLGGIIGVLIGLTSGFYGGKTDNVIMRCIDTWTMLPMLMMIIVIVTILPNRTIPMFILIVTAFLWMPTARIIRAKALQQSSLDYVLASKTLGTPNIIIMLREVLPNLVSVITLNLTLALAANMGIETTLSFLGFGLPFATPSLGTLISYASDPATLQNRIWQWLPPALLIFILMLSVCFIGQALNRAADVKQRKV